MQKPCLVSEDGLAGGRGQEKGSWGYWVKVQKFKSERVQRAGTELRIQISDLHNPERIDHSSRTMKHKP
jgi:hypothetical protein